MTPEAIEQLKAENARLQERCKNQAGEIRVMQSALAKKNLALDAMWWVWCSGGCPKGAGRYTTATKRDDANGLTEEVVATAERNTKRLRAWFNTYNFRRLPEAEKRALWKAANPEAYKILYAEESGQ